MAEICCERFVPMGSYEFLEVPLRKSKIKNEFPVLSNASTIMGICNTEPNPDFGNVEGKLNIRLTKTDSFNFDVVNTKLNEVFTKTKTKSLSESDEKNNIHFETILGEHDLFFSIDWSELALKLYTDKNNGFIHIGKPEYSSNFFQANTEISVTIDYDNLKPYNFNFDVSKRQNLDKTHIDKIKLNIEEIIKNPIFTKAPYLQETLWILYEDYTKNYSSTFSYPWIQDLKFYFESMLQYLKALAKEDNKIPNKTKYECVDIVVSSMRHMILHVSQANRLFFEIPNTHLRHTGTYSKILRAYQGIIKEYLDLAYSIPKYSGSPLVIPAITFDVTPITISESCPGIKTVDIEGNDITYQIIKIKLPYEALIDINKYALLLAHEIYHYIPPRDRKVRNTLLGTICLNIIFTQLLMLYIEDSLIAEFGEKLSTKEWYNVSDKIKNCLEPYLLNYILNNYNKIKGTVNINKDDFEWRKYYTLLTKATKEKTPESCIDELFNLFSHLNFDIICEKEFNDSEIELLKRAKELINRQIDNGQQYFKTWITKNQINIRLFAKDWHVQYAIRETLADYFMFQATDSDKKSYLELILNYKDILSKPEDESITQRYRLILGLKYILHLDIFDENVESIIFNELSSFISEEDIKYIRVTCVSYRSAIQIYDIIIQKLFDSLNFNKIEEEDTYDVFKNKKECLKDFFSNVKVPTDVYSKFEQNIYFVERFQNQKEFQSIKLPKNLPESKYSQHNNILNEIIESNHYDVSKYRINFRKLICRSLDDILTRIQNKIKELSDEEEITPIWFRGQSDSSYKLLPSLYRMNKGKTFYNPEITKLRPTIESLFKSFRVKSFGAPEIFRGGNDSVIGTLASMQHYEVPTNILDWSTSLFVAIYFAVEKQMVYSKGDMEKRKPCANDADIWLLNPVRLNLAREYLLGNRMDDDEAEKMIYYPIPSIFGTEPEYQEYLPFAEKLNNPQKFPLAIYVPFVNPRIKAQVGTFTMFSLDVKADSQTYNFNEYALEKLQEKYKNVSGDKYKPFLERVTISKECVNEVADWLRIRGVTKSTVYPDLSNISENTTNEVKNFIEKNNTK